MICICSVATHTGRGWKGVLCEHMNSKSLRGQYRQILLTFSRVPGIMPSAGRVAVNENSPNFPALRELIFQRAEALE